MYMTRLFLIVLINTVCKKVEKFAVDADPLETTSEKLRRILFCDYDPNLRPVVHHLNKTVMSFKFLVNYFTYDDELDTVTFDVILEVTWEDQHLKWKPEEYDSIKKIYEGKYSIWSPDLSVYNRVNDVSSPNILIDGQCTIFFNGTVRCSNSVHLEALCIAKLDKYPFDTQKCTLRLGSWIHKGEELDIEINKDIWVMENMKPNGEWHIVSTAATRNPGIYKNSPNDSYPSVHIDIYIKRLEGAHAASVVIPSVVVVIITLTSLFSSPLNEERLVLCYVNIITQTLHIQYLQWQIPLKGRQVPFVLLFARDSLLLATFVMVFTLIFKNIMERKTSPPVWISCVVSSLWRWIEKVQYVDHFANDNIQAVEDDKTSTSQDWLKFGKMLDTILFGCCFFVYFVISIVMLV